MKLNFFVPRRRVELRSDVLQTPAVTTLATSAINQNLLRILAKKLFLFHNSVFLNNIGIYSVVSDEYCYHTICINRYPTFIRNNTEQKWTDFCRIIISDVKNDGINIVFLYLLIKKLRICHHIPVVIKKGCRVRLRAGIHIDLRDRKS